MYIDDYVARSLRDSLTALEGELERPIRLLQNGSRRSAEMAWRGMLADHDGITQEQAAESGITVFTTSRDPNRTTLHYDLHHEGFTYYDVTGPRNPAMPINVGEWLIGEITGPRCVTMYMRLNDGFNFVPPSILHAYCEAIRISCQPDLAERWDEIRAEQQRAAFDHYVRTSYERRFQIHRDSIDTHQRQIISWTDAIVTAQREIEDSQAMLDALLSMEESSAHEQFTREWARLEDHPRIAELGFSGTQIEITTTDDMRLYHPTSGESRWLGRFQIKLNIQTMQINLHNLDTRRGGRDHPHILDGRPCMGGHGPAFVQLLQGGDVYTLFELLVQYIESLNIYDEYGRYGSYWFDAEDERPLEVADEAELVTA